MTLKLMTSGRLAESPGVPLHYVQYALHTRKIEPAACAGRLADAGKMPAPVRLGALVRWQRDKLVEWIAEGCSPSGSDEEHASEPVARSIGNSQVRIDEGGKR